MNEAKPKWVSPLCGKVSPLHTMAIDEYFVNIIKDEEMTFCSEVILHEDGALGCVVAQTYPPAVL